MYFEWIVVFLWPLTESVILHVTLVYQQHQILNTLILIHNINKGK